YALAADNVLDALLVDAEGHGRRRVLGDPRRKLGRCLRVEALALDTVAAPAHWWHHVGPALPDEFYISIFLTIGGSDSSGNATVSFTGLVLGPKELVMSRFPELGLNETEVSEMSWVESAARFAWLSSAEELTSRDTKTKRYYGNMKSDYVRQPIPTDAIAAIIR
ncbi:hypothetical protein EJB05_49735, partial [Eragrostis curvula]